MPLTTAKPASTVTATSSSGATLDTSLITSPCFPTAFTVSAATIAQPVATYAAARATSSAAFTPAIFATTCASSTASFPAPSRRAMQCAWH